MTDKYTNNTQIVLPSALACTPRIAEGSPLGWTHLPQIEFPRNVVRNGLSRQTLESLPDQQLAGIVPAYAGMKDTDTIQLMVAAKGHDPVHVGAVPVVSVDRATKVAFVRTAFERDGFDGEVDFFYYIRTFDKVLSERSRPAVIDVSLQNAPQVLPPPIILTRLEGLVTENDIKPALPIVVPQFSPSARHGDVVVLMMGKTPIQLFSVDTTRPPSFGTASFAITYDDMWRLAAARGYTHVPAQFFYRVYRHGVVSQSALTETIIDLSVAGGRDPRPETPENEKLRHPSLRGATGTRENVIDVEDIDADARVIIDTTHPRGALSHFILQDDVITVTLDGEVVGESTRVGDPATPIEVAIPSHALKLNPGTRTLAYSVERALTTANAKSVAYSPGQLVQIHTPDELPGGGSLGGAIFVAGKVREESSGFYALYLRDVAGEFTPLRVYGYLNMAEGDTIQVTYTGYDAFEGGSVVESGSGTLTYVVKKYDLFEKDDELNEGMKRVFVDIPFESRIVKNVAFGRIESYYEVRNLVGSVRGVNRSTLVSART